MNRKILLNLFRKRYQSIMTWGLLFILWGGFLFQTPQQAVAQNKGISKHGASFLQVSPYSRQVGLGEAFTGLADDISVIRYNIGGLGSLANAMAAFHFHNWIDDTQQGGISGALPTRLGILGFDFNFFNEGLINEIDESFNYTGQKFESNDIELTIGYGRFFALLDSGISVGASVRYLRQNLADDVASGVGMDVGAIFHTRYVSFGLTIQNLGITKLQYHTRNETLPESYRGGIGLHLAAGRSFNLNMATDVAFVTNQSLRYYSGLETVIGNLVALRGGYKFHNWEASRWSMGFGLYIPMEWLAGSESRLDYAYSPLDAFESTAHRFSLTFSFGALKRRQLAQLYDEQRLVRLIYEEKKSAEMRDKIAQELEAAKKARDAAEEARRAAEDAEKRTKALEEEMKKRLEQVKAIAESSEGKIEVTQQPDEKVQVTLRINFDFDSAVIRPEEYTTMKKVAQILNTYPTSQVFISGHTDNIGTEEYNIRLSERRIQGVMSYLTTRENVTGSRFFMPIGYGEMKPIAPNTSEAERFRNRRVDFLIYTRDQKPEMPEGSAIRNIFAIDNSTVHIVCNGKVNFTQTYLSNPERIVIDLPNIFLLFDMSEFILEKGPFKRARVAFHPGNKYSRVVLDLSSPVKYQIESIENILKISLTD